MRKKIELPWQDWQMVDTDVVAKITGRSMRAIKRDRTAGVGIPYKKLSGTAVRYLVGDIKAWLHKQPGGNGDTPKAFPTI